MLRRFTRVQLVATLRDPMDCSSPGSSVHGILQEGYWSGLPRLPPRDLPCAGIKPISLISPALAGGSFLTTPNTQLFIQDFTSPLSF